MAFYLLLLTVLELLISLIILGYFYNLFFSHFIHSYYFMLMIIRSSKTFFYSLSNTKFIAFAFGINLH